MVVYVLDTSLLLGGRDPPPDGSWVTTSAAAAEISPGGRDARRYTEWRDIGLTLRDPLPASLKAVQRVAEAAGNWRRLSEADASLLALALEAKATLLTDDYTMLDVAKRLDVTARTVNTKGIARTQSWRPRCSGCGRWFDEHPGADCPVCGSPVKDKPRR